MSKAYLGSCLQGVSDEEVAGLPIRYRNGRDNDWMHPLAETRYL